MDAEQLLALAAQRATQSAWDLVWWGAAAQDLPMDPLPVHLPIFPATLLGVPPSVVLSALPSRVPHRRIIAAIDEQFVSGDPISLRRPLDALRESGMAVCLDTADLGRACLECLVLLRPEWVRLDAELTRDLPSNRGRRAAVARFVQVCNALDISTIATTTTPESHETLAELGVLAAAVEPSTTTSG
jgi:EAL domain-containing protein (putative c-di-GMP-specific phosphodiesterase class I)